MATCGIALGGNLGNTPETFQRALMRLDDEVVQLRSVSRFLTTSPMGADAGDEFVNAAALVETEIQPVELLKRLHKIEAELGRTRDMHWGPRSLDLDLVFYDQTIACTEQIVVPHPAFWYRHFVLAPLAEIAAEYRHPILNETVGELFKRLQHRPLKVAIVSNHVSSSDVADLESNLQKSHGNESARLIKVPAITDTADFFALVTSDVDDNQIKTIQPSHESGRLIRVRPGSDSEIQRFEKTLDDLCTAALG